MPDAIDVLSSYLTIGGSPRNLRCK